MVQAADAGGGYVRRMGTFSAAMLVIGGVIGAGIFLNPAVVAQRTGSGAAVLTMWVLGGALTLIGALCFAELGARRPQAGGSYVYLREAFGSLPAFLFGWTMLVANYTGSIAAVAITFGRYAATAAGASERAAPAFAVGAIVLLAMIHARGIGAGALAQNILTLLKLTAIAVLVATGLWLAADHLPAALAHDGAVAQGSLSGALLPVLFTYGGFAYLNTLAGEVRDPERTLPRALILGMLGVMVAYLLANVAYLAVLGRAGLAASPAPAAVVMQQGFGAIGARLIAAGIAASTFGYCAVALGGAARVLQTMAAQGLFFRGLAALHPTRHTPQRALALLAVWAILLALSGSFGALLNYTTVADWLGYAGAVTALFWYRRMRADEAVVYRVPLYPWLPLLFIVVVAAVVMVTVIASPGDAGMGALVVLLGVPAYYGWHRLGSTAG